MMNMKSIFRLATASGLLTMAVGLLPAPAHAQLSSNPDKFLGNITTSYNVDYGNEPFHTLWNQITPENESKWGSVEDRRGHYNWGGCDNAYNYAKEYGFPFKFHCLIWGSQYPSFLDSMSPEEQLKAIEQWMDAVKERYPDLPLIDVVNEAVAGHAPAPYRAALGGEGRTGYDWIIRAFEMAHDRWPDAILIYNDYNTFQWQRQQFIDLVTTLRDAGAPIDAYGCQSHDLTDMDANAFRSAMDEIQQALQIPMYSTEYDIGTPDDQKQLNRYKEQIPYMWEADYCAGITLWGYIYGRTWTTDGNSGIIKNGQDRPAMTWLREYMQTDAARNAKSPFPGMVKEASIYVKPSVLNATQGEPMTIDVRASLHTKTIAQVDLYLDGELLQSMTQAPYIAELTPDELGHHALKAVVTSTDGSQYTRLGGFNVFGPRAPFGDAPIQLPGRLEVEDFDQGGEGLSFHDSDARDEGGARYRSDNAGVDIIKTDEGYAIGYTAQGEWLEYTVDVQEAGIYSFDAYAATGNSSSTFSLSVYDDNGMRQLTGNIGIPCVADGDWSHYVNVHGVLSAPLSVGRQVIRLTITNSYCNIDHIDFQLAERAPYDGVIAIPGTIEAENFDEGGEGLSFHDSDANDEGNARYRYDNGGVDIVQGNGSYALGYTAQGEWTEYTVDVQEAGDYHFKAYVASGNDGASFDLQVADGDSYQTVASVKIPRNANGGWDDYQLVTGQLTQPLNAGEQVMRILITGPYGNIDKIELIAGTLGIEQVGLDHDAPAAVINLSGQLVGPDYKGIVIHRGHIEVR